MTRTIRTILTALATAITVIDAIQDTLPLWARAAIAGASTTLAALGIVPIHLPATTPAPTTAAPELAPTGDDARTPADLSAGVGAD